MKTAEDYLNDLSTDTTTKGRVKWVDAIAAMKAYAREACKEQREICAEAVSQRSSALSGLVGHLIKNAPEPTML